MLKTQNLRLKGAGIVVTRPLAQAGKLSTLINEQGGKTISFPLIDILPLQDYSAFDTAIKNITSYDWAVFISSNAVKNGMPRVLKQYPALPPCLKFSAIGPVTASELLAYGISNVLIPNNRFDSESLLSLPEMYAMQGKKVMIFRGIGGREVLADTLTSRGANVTFAECYQRVNPQTNCVMLEELWRNGQCHAIVVTSSEAMRYLLQMTNHADNEWLYNIKICVNHARIAEEAKALATHLQIHIADAPGDAAMLACLEACLQGPIHTALS